MILMYKTLTGSKPLRIKFDKIDRFIRVYDETRYLVSFGGKKYDIIYNKIKHLNALIDDNIMRNIFRKKFQKL